MFVEQSLHGDVPAVMTVRRLGGEVLVPGAERHEPGGACVLSLRRRDGRWWLTATGQSKWTLSGPDGALVATRDVSASAYRRDGDSHLRPCRPKTESMPLRELHMRASLAAINAWKARQP